MASLATLIAHGGWGGLAVEIAGVVAILALGLAFWVGNRRPHNGEDHE